MNRQELQVLAACISRIHHDSHMPKFHVKHALRILQSVHHKLNKLPIESRSSVSTYYKLAERRRLNNLIKSAKV